MMIFNHTSRIFSSGIWRVIQIFVIENVLNCYLQHYSELSPESYHCISVKQSKSMFFSHWKIKLCQSNHSLEAACFSSKVSQQHSPPSPRPYLSLLLNFHFRNNLYLFAVIFDTAAKMVLKFYPTEQSHGRTHKNSLPLKTATLT